MLFTSMTEQVFIVTYSEPLRGTPDRPFWSGEQEIVAENPKQAVARFLEWAGKYSYAVVISVRRKEGHAHPDAMHVLR